MKVFVLMALSLVTSSQAMAWDGCYQLVDTGVMYPAICFQGTNEEGINGTNVRLFVFGTNTNVLDTCAIGSVTKLTRSALTFSKNGIDEVVLTNFDGNVADADIDGFPGPVKAVRLSDESASNLLQNADSNVCR